MSQPLLFLLELLQRTVARILFTGTPVDEILATFSSLGSVALAKEALCLCASVVNPLSLRSLRLLFKFLWLRCLPMREWSNSCRMPMSISPTASRSWRWNCSMQVMNRSGCWKLRPKTEVRGQKSEVRSQRGICNPGSSSGDRFRFHYRRTGREITRRSAGSIIRIPAGFRSPR